MTNPVGTAYDVRASLTNGGMFLVDLSPNLDAYNRRQVAGKLSAMTPLLHANNVRQCVEIPATWAAYVQLEESFGERLSVDESVALWRQNAILARVNALSGVLTSTVPESITPYPWQLEGASLIGQLGKVMLNDDPGTGKTATTILGLREHNTLGKPTLPVVVVAPASMMDTWASAFEWLAPEFHAIPWRGTPKQREKLAGTADVYVASYDTARIDVEKLGRMKPRAVVLDECHAIKNPQSKRSKACRKLAKKAACVVALSGTPISHGPHDMWPALEALEPGAWPSLERWVQRYCLTRPGYMKDEIVGLSPVTEKEFRRITAGQIRRIAKADVLYQLPPKVYSTRTVDLTPAYRKIYDDLEAKMIAEMPSGEEMTVMSGIALYTRLTQLASATADVWYTEELDNDGSPQEKMNVRLTAPSWKVDALLEIMAERPGEPVVAFSPSRQLINLAGEAAEKAGYRVGYVVGGQKPEARTAAVDAFQAGELDLIAVTTQAGGVGLTLTRSSTAVFLTRPWAYIESSQAEDRLHRIGAEGHESVEIIDVVARATIDDHIRSVLQVRAGSWAEMAQDPRILTEALGGKAA